MKAPDDVVAGTASGREHQTVTYDKDDAQEGRMTQHSIKKVTQHQHIFRNMWRGEGWIGREGARNQGQRGRTVAPVLAQRGGVPFEQVDPVQDPEELRVVVLVAVQKGERGVEAAVHRQLRLEVGPAVPLPRHAAVVPVSQLP